MTPRWTPQTWRERPAQQIPTDYPDPAALKRVEEALRTMPPLVFAGEAQRPEEGVGPGGPRRGLPAAGRRLRRELQGIPRRQHPRHLPGDAADGGDPDLRGRPARGEGRPHRRPVRQAALEPGGDPGRGDPAVLPRRHHQRHGVRAGGPHARSGAAAQGLPPVLGHPEPDPRLRRRRLCGPLQRPRLDARLRGRQPAGRALPRPRRQDLRDARLHGGHRRHARPAAGAAPGRLLHQPRGAAAELRGGADPRRFRPRATGTTPPPT